MKSNAKSVYKSSFGPIDLIRPNSSGLVFFLSSNGLVGINPIYFANPIIQIPINQSHGLQRKIQMSTLGSLIYDEPSLHPHFSCDFALVFWLLTHSKPTSPIHTHIEMTLERGNSNRVCIGFDVCRASNDQESQWDDDRHLGERRIW